MRKQRRYLLYLLPSAIVVGTIVLGIVFGTAALHPTQQVGAAPIKAKAIQKMTEFTDVLPMKPMWEQAVNMAAPQAALACLKSNTQPLCYSPQQMRQAYGVQPLLDAGITGKGRIITLIEAFQDPTLQADLQLFDKAFGLPDPQVNIIAPFGNTPFDANDPIQTGWAGETALDVEWAHAMAPDATINVIQANVKQKTLQGQLTALLQATKFAVQQNIGSVISMSFGTSEQCLGATFIQQAHAIFQQARTQKQTVLASAGDAGSGVVQCAANGQGVTLAQGVNYPASDPLITSVGGTTLLAGPTGTYQSETTWNNAQQGQGATGGGSSTVFAKPAFQQNLQGTTRKVGDLSFNADPSTGVPVVTGSLKPGMTMMIPIGGTSLGAPAVAGMVALFDQAAGGVRMGFLNDAIYRISQNVAAYTQAFHDVQSGNNAFVFQGANGNAVNVGGFNAAAGWDIPTGVGTPNAANLMKVLPQFVKPNDGGTL